MPVQGFTAVVDITWGLSTVYPDAWLSLKVSPLHWQLPCDQQAGETCHSHGSGDYNERVCGEPDEDGGVRGLVPQAFVCSSSPLEGTGFTEGLILETGTGALTPVAA